MAASSKSKKGFFERLKSVFIETQKCNEIDLTEPLRLCKESVRIPLDNCPLEISLNVNSISLNLVPEQYIGEKHGNDKFSLLLFNPDYFYTQISAFIRIAEGDHLIVGREDEHQHVLFHTPDKIAKQQFAIIHEGSSLLIKDLQSEQGTTLTPHAQEKRDFNAMRMDNLREIRRIFRGPIELLPAETALEDLNKVNRLLEKEPLRPKDDDGMPGGVVSLPKKMIPIIIGDLHAQVNNLLTLLTQNRFLEMLSDGKAAMVFLGDAVHSEMDGCLEEMESSLLMMDIILRLKLWFPQQVFYVRGNHDSFSDEIGKAGIPQGLLWAQAIQKARGEAYKKAMDRFYELLPYVLLSKNYVACHAAPPKGKVDMDMLVNIKKYPGLIQEVTCNRLYRPNRLAGYTKGDVKRFRKALNLQGKAELFVGHTPLTRHETLWLNVGGIEHHDVVFSGNIPWIGVFTRVQEQMIPLRYRSESLLEILNNLDDVELYDELAWEDSYARES